MLLLKRLSFGSVEVHTLHPQATIGTPLLVPVPKNVIFKEGETILQNYDFLTGRFGIIENEPLSSSVHHITSGFQKSVYRNESPIEEADQSMC